MAARGPAGARRAPGPPGSNSSTTWSSSSRSSRHHGDRRQSDRHAAWSSAWWCWPCSGGAGPGSPCWATLVRTDQGIVPVLGFVTVAAAFVLALSLPKAFVDRARRAERPAGLRRLLLPGPGEPDGDLRCGSARGDPARAPTLAAARPAAGWWPRPSRRRRAAAAAALRRDSQSRRPGSWPSGSRPLRGVRSRPRAWRGTGWTVLSAGHWAERHALIVLIALGESIIALGFGPATPRPAADLAGA